MEARCLPSPRPALPTLPPTSNIQHPPPTHRGTPHLPRPRSCEPRTVALHRPHLDRRHQFPLEKPTRTCALRDPSLRFVFLLPCQPAPRTRWKDFLLEPIRTSAQKHSPVALVALRSSIPTFSPPRPTERAQLRSAPRRHPSQLRHFSPAPLRRRGCHLVPRRVSCFCLTLPPREKKPSPFIHDPSSLHDLICLDTAATLHC